MHKRELGHSNLEVAASRFGLHGGEVNVPWEFDYRNDKDQDEDRAIE